MTKLQRFRLTIFAVVVLVLPSPIPNPKVIAQSIVVPNAYESGGTSTFLGPMANSQRTYQLLINSSQLTPFVGLQLNSVSWRLPESAAADWPASEITFDNFDIYLSPSVAPADRSLTFANNIAGTQVQVRSGSLTVPADSFSFGGSPNDWGLQIDFDPYLYTGGHLLFELRHTGFAGTSRSVDAVGTAAATGYGTDFSAAWTGNYEGVTGSQGNFSVVRFTAVPEPGSAGLIGVAVAGLALFSRRRT